MAKVHPAGVPEPAATTIASRSAAEDQAPMVLTVWRKSLLFNCHGFTVFDAKGNLAFRVDCYASTRRRAEVLLMDPAGSPLLTIRRKGLISLADHWVIYHGDGDGAATPLLSVRRHASLRGSSNKALAHVTPLASTTSASGTGAYVVEGSYGRRACAVRDASGHAVAEVCRKESVGDDVFRLVADPRLGAPLAMAVVIALDEMFAGASARSMLRRTWSAY